MIVHVGSAGAPGDGPSSQRPAKANSPSSRRRMKWGNDCRPSFCHSKKPSAGIRQRRCPNAPRNAGRVPTVSARALMSGFFRNCSPAQLGRSPHRARKIRASSRPASDGRLASAQRTANTGCVGAILNRAKGFGPSGALGANSGPGDSAAPLGPIDAEGLGASASGSTRPRCSTTASIDARNVNRPHMTALSAA